MFDYDDQNLIAKSAVAWYVHKELEGQASSLCARMRGAMTLRKPLWQEKAIFALSKSPGNAEQRALFQFKMKEHSRFDHHYKKGSGIMDFSNENAQIKSLFCETTKSCFLAAKFRAIKIQDEAVGKN